MIEWAGKRYWLVGASEGLGAALAHKMSAAGVHLFLSARSEDKLNDLAASLPGKSDVVPVDVSDSESVKAAAEAVGDIDGVVQIAGVYWPFGAKNWDEDQAIAMADINFTGAMRLMGAVVPKFVERDAGHIVLTGSLSGFRGLPGAAAYTSSKAGVMTLAESLYADLHKTNVRPCFGEWHGRFEMEHISANKVAAVIVMARELGRAEGELRGFIDRMGEEEQAALVTVMWIGRGAFEVEEWNEAFETAMNEATTPTADYLIGTPHLADHLEAGLDALGISAVDEENQLM